MADRTMLRECRNRKSRTAFQTNLSADFISSSIPLAENNRYVPELDRFVSKDQADHHEDTMLDLWNDASAEKDKLVLSMEKLRQKSQSKTDLQNEVAAKSFTWKEVLAEIQTAGDAYRKTVFARTCEKSEVFEHWLTLLPNGTYASTISGAFIMVVQGARTISSLQRSIYEALASIPDTLSHANSYIEIYKAHSSDMLVRRTADLCKTIFIILRLVVDFFLRSSLQRSAAAVLKGGRYQQELAEYIADMNNQSLKLREEANVCLQIRIAEMDKKCDSRALREQSRHELAKEELLLAIDTSSDVTAAKVCTLLLRHLQSHPEFDVKTGAALICSDSESTNETGGSLPRISASASQNVAIDALLGALEHEPHIHQEDVDYCLTLGFTQNPDFQNRASWVLQSTRLREFLSGGTRSKLLLINGNHDATQFLSPLSFVCSKITDLVSVSKQVISLSYVCGRHADERREPRANATGLVADLLGQLLTQVDRKFRSQDRGPTLSLTKSQYRAAQREDMRGMFDIFESTICGLAKGSIVFCLIDGLSTYENRDRRDDTIDLMRRISRLVKRTRHVGFRCIVTYPGRGIWTDAWAIDFDDKKAIALEVPENVR